MWIKEFKDDVISLKSVLVRVSYTKTMWKSLGGAGQGGGFMQGMVHTRVCVHKHLVEDSMYDKGRNICLFVLTKMFLLVTVVKVTVRFRCSVISCFNNGTSA